MCTQTLQVAGAIAFERFCQHHSIRHPSIFELIDRLWGSASAECLELYRAVPVALSDGTRGLDDLEEAVPTRLWKTFRRLVDLLVEIAFVDMYGDGAKEVRRYAEWVVTTVADHGIDLADLPQLTRHQRRRQQGPIDPEVVASWQSLRTPSRIEVVVSSVGPEIDVRKTSAAYQRFADVIAELDDDATDQHALVLADRLQELGDPRGELIVVQHQRRSSSNNKHRRLLQSHADRLINAHTDLWVPPGLAKHELRWRGDGFVHSLQISGSHAGRHQLASWLRHPSLCALRELVLDGYAVMALPELPQSLRRLVLNPPAALNAEVEVLWAPDLALEVVHLQSSAARRCWWCHDDECSNSAR